MIKYDNCKSCKNARCEHYGKDREFVVPSNGRTCKVIEEPADKFALCVMWYGRNDDGSPNYDDVHRGTIKDKTCAGLMHQYRELSYNHDCAKYTQTEITGVYEL